MRALLLAAFLTGPCGAALAATDSVRVERACFAEAVRVTGVVAPRGQTAVAWPVEGYRIADVLVHDGDKVKVDQPLVRLVRVAPTPPGAPATGPVVLKAPADATVGTVAAQVGAPTQAAGEPLVRLVTDPALDLVVSVPSLYVTRMRAGAGVRVTTDDGTDLSGSVRRAATDVDPATQFGRAFVTLPDAPGLKAGLFASALVDVGQSCGLAVPKTAVIRLNDRASVRLVRNGQAQTRAVRVGLSSEDRVEIRDGLAEGDLVVEDAGRAF